MKKLTFLSKILMVTLAFTFCNCSETNGQKAAAKAEIKTLVAPDAFETIAGQTNVQLVDVRTPEEFQSGHIGNAANINFRDADFKDKMGKLDKSKPVAVYCGVGGRSGKTIAILKELGFTTIYDLEGGITAWKAKGKKVIQ